MTINLELWKGTHARATRGSNSFITTRRIPENWAQSMKGYVEATRYARLFNKFI